MKDRYSWRNSIKQITENRAARGMAALLSVLLYLLTLFEFTELRLELEIPVLADISGGQDGLLF